MNFLDLKKHLSAKPNDTVYLLNGNDAYFREKAVEMLKKEYILEPSVNFTNFDGDAVTNDVGGFISAVKSYPFLSEKRMVLVREFYPKIDFIEKVKELFETPIKETILVFSNAKACELLKKQKGIVFVDCSKADSKTLSKWIINELDKKSIQISDINAELLADYCLQDMTKISNEVAKLIAYFVEGGVVGKNDLDNLVSKDSEYKIYELTDCIGKKNVHQALQIIDEMLLGGEAYQKLMFSIFNYFKRLLYLSVT